MNVDSPMGSEYGGFDDYDDYYPSDAWSDTSGSEAPFRFFIVSRRVFTIDEYGVEYYRLQDTPSSFEKAVGRLLKDIKPRHSSVKIISQGNFLGREGTSALLAGLATQATRWVGFRAECDNKWKGTYNPLPMIIHTLFLLPNLVHVELSFRSGLETTSNLFSLLELPKLEILALTDHQFTTDLLPSFLQKVHQTLPASSLRHLSLSRISHRGNLFPEIMALVELGRIGGLEYLDLQGLEVFKTQSDFVRLVEEIEAHNPILLGLRLSYRDFDQDSEVYGRLKAAVRRNRSSRLETRGSALELLGQLRILLHQPTLSLTSLTLSPKDKSFADLPTEVLLQIVSQLDSIKSLSARQVANIVEYASGRESLAVGFRAEGEREFLERMDCWRWDGCA